MWESPGKASHNVQGFELFCSYDCCWARPVDWGTELRHVNDSFMFSQMMWQSHDERPIWQNTLCELVIRLWFFVVIFSISLFFFICARPVKCDSPCWITHYTVHWVLLGVISVVQSLNYKINYSHFSLFINGLTQLYIFYHQICLTQVFELPVYHIVSLFETES